jgi:hypothetical protein
VPLHERPHAPQLLSSNWVSVHAPLQIVPTDVHRQCPPVQAAPVAVHAAPHAPQLVMLLKTSVQPLPQSFCPVGQTHEPFWHVCP